MPQPHSDSGIAEGLDGLVEFDVPFTITLSPSGPGFSRAAAEVHVPYCVTIRKGSQEVLVDFDAPENSPWDPVSGHSGQHGYAGPVMHSSEFLGGPMARSVLEVEEPTTWVVMEVFVEDDEEVDFGDPAGWILLRLR
ncbi:MAG: hypothetical protein Q4C81_04355 [Kocuria sp.]|nr:hypothetical protein [Kocuria sp.]